MGYTIVSGNKPSSLALHRNHAIVFNEMLLNKCQSFILNHKMPNIKWDGTEDPTIHIHLFCKGKYCNVGQTHDVTDVWRSGMIKRSKDVETKRTRIFSTRSIICIILPSLM